MPTITNPWKFYLRTAHNRRPRNQHPTLLLNTPRPVNQSPLPSLPNPYIITNLSASIAAQLKFWTANDGTNGKFPNGKLIHAPEPQPNLTTAEVPQDLLTSPNDITVTSWYFPIQIGIGGPPPSGPTSIIDDAFSVAKGDFIDDIFITAVMPDQNNLLKTRANNAGFVETTSAETLVAETSLAAPSNETFLHWESIDAGVPAGNSNTLVIPEGSVGIAIAIYQNQTADDDAYCAGLLREEKKLLKKITHQRLLLQQSNLTRLERQKLLDQLADLNDQFVNLELEILANCQKH